MSIAVLIYSNKVFNVRMIVTSVKLTNFWYSDGLLTAQEAKQSVRNEYIHYSPESIEKNTQNYFH